MEYTPHYYFKEDGLIRSVSPGWEFTDYGFMPNNMGDTLFASIHCAMTEMDMEMLELVGKYLKEGKRWPDKWMIGNEDKFAKNMLQTKWSQYQYKKGKRKHKLFRQQKGFLAMTRDPHSMFDCACVLMEREDLLKEVKPAWYNWRPTYNWWRRYLITKNKFWLRAWEFAVSLSNGAKTPVFAHYLGAWKAYIVDSSKVKKQIGKHTTSWNYGIRQLIHHPLRYLDRPLEYKPHFGFEWQKDLRLEPYKNKLIEETVPDAWYMDLEILTYIWTRNRILFPEKKGWDTITKVV